MPTWQLKINLQAPKQHIKALRDTEEKHGRKSTMLMCGGEQTDCTEQG